MKHNALALLLLACSIAVLGCHSDEPTLTPLHFVLTFKDANGLRPGQFLVYKGVRIGEVMAVDLAGERVKVNVTIDESHRMQVYKEATFKIETLTLINPTGEHQVVMSDSGDVRTPVEEATVITGSEGWLSDAKDKVKQTATSAAHAIGAALDPAPTATTSKP